MRWPSSPPLRPSAFRREALAECGAGMSVVSSSTVCHVLREDPELADSIPPERRGQALEECVAPEFSLQPGRWGGRGSLGFRGGIGVLVLNGLMIRRVGIDGRFGAELIGEGDLLRPNEESVSPLLPLSTDWSIVLPTRLAALDLKFEQQLAR